MRDNNRLLFVVEIPNYPSEVLISNKIRPVFYVHPDSKIRGNKNIPKSFWNTEKYFFDERGVLFSKSTMLPHLANPRKAGLARYWVVNFQDIWNQSVTRQSRALRVDKLKLVLKPYIEQIPVITEFPIEVSINIYDIKMPVDISNKGVIYTKIIEDLMKSEGKIPDDKIEYVNCSGRTKFIQIDNIDDKKMEIKIFRSDNNPI